jgi:hypothetical protein
MLVLFCLMLHATAAIAADVDIDIVYPPSANVFDVVRDGGVDNTGKTDVTRQLQQLISERANSVSILYFPKGTYLVSGELVVKIDRSRNNASHSHGPWIVGEKRSETIIRLKDGTWPTPAYDLMDDQRATRIDRQVVLSTGDSTNTTFNKTIRNLTINTGRGNAGAIGLQYCVSNTGYLGEVSIVSEDGRGVAALALSGVENGPGQVRNVRTRGFDVGLYNVAMHMMSLSHLTIEDARRVGVINAGMAAAEDLRVTMREPGPALVHRGGSAFSLVGGSFTGQGEVAVQAEGPLFYLRDVTASGYEGVVEKGRTKVDEHVSGRTASLFDRGGRSLALPIKPEPIVPYERDMSKWANVLDYGAVGDGLADDTAAIQRALNDTTKTHVVFPFSGKPWGENERHLVPEKIGRRYRVTGSLTLGPTIQRVVGVPAHIVTDFKDRATFIIGDGVPDVVVIEGLRPSPPIVVRTSRTVVLSSVEPRWPWGSLKDEEGNAVRGYEASTNILLEGTGDVFLNDVQETIVVNNPRQNVWIRFFNDERGWWLSMPTITVKAGSVWVLGWKSEAFNRRVLVEEQGRLEMFGYMSYSQTKKAAVPEEDVPIIDNQGGQISVINIAQRGVRKYAKLVAETLGGETRVLTAKDNGGADLGLYSSVNK